MRITALDISNPQIAMARLFAVAAHSADRTHGPTGQRRKYMDEPYYVHPEHVGAILQGLQRDQETKTYDGKVVVTTEMIQAALLHDVVEDTGITIELIEQEFGPVVAELVSGLTDVSKPEDGNRKIRKALDLEHTRVQSPQVKTVKLADIISNSPSIIAYAGGFAHKWMEEKKAIMEALVEGDSILHAMAAKISENFYNK